MTICLITAMVINPTLSRHNCLSLWSAHVGLPRLSHSRIKIDEWMAGGKIKKKGGKIKEEGIRGRETVVLFSLVWHYLSLLINPLRPSARRSEGNGGREGAAARGKTWARWGLPVCRWRYHTGATIRLMFYLHMWISPDPVGSADKIWRVLPTCARHLLTFSSILRYALFLCKVVTEKWKIKEKIN